ncbi:MAG: ABC transporter substrate-binding protein [Thermodesulfobacteriota bacterium]
MKRSLLLLLLVWVLFGGVNTQGHAAAKSDPITIGVMYPVTGPLALTGEKMVIAAKYSFEEVGYEVAGRKIKVIVEDSGSNPATALDKAKKMVERDKIHMLIGPLIGPVKLAVGTYMQKVGIPHIATHPAAWPMSTFKWSFMVGGSELHLSSCMGRYTAEQMGIKTVTTITNEMINARGFLGAFTGAFRSLGGRVVQEQFTPFPCNDFASYLTALKDADSLAAWYDAADAIRFLTQLHEFGVLKRMNIVGAFHGSFFEPFILEALPPDVSASLIGKRCSIDYTNRLDNEISKRFVKDFKEKKGFVPDGASEGVHLGVEVALRALKATGGDTTPAKLREAILALQFDTTCGPIRFDKNTQMAVRNVSIVEIKKVEGHFVLDPVYAYKQVPPQGYGPPPPPPPAGK